MFNGKVDNSWYVSLDYDNKRKNLKANYVVQWYSVILEKYWRRQQI